MDLERAVSALIKLSQDAGKRESPPTDVEVGAVLTALVPGLADSDEASAVGTAFIQCIDKQKPALRGHARLGLGLDQSELGYSNRCREIFGGNTSSKVWFPGVGFMITQVLIDLLLEEPKDNHLYTMSGFRLTSVAVSRLLREEDDNSRHRHGTIRLTLKMACGTDDALALPFPVTTGHTIRAIRATEVTPSSRRPIGSCRTTHYDDYSQIFAINPRSAYIGADQRLIVMPLDHAPRRGSLIEVEVDGDIAGIKREPQFFSEQVSWRTTPAGERVILTLARDTTAPRRDVETAALAPGSLEAAIFQVDQPGILRVVAKELPAKAGTEAPFLGATLVEAHTDRTYPAGTHIRLRDVKTID